MKVLFFPKVVENIKKLGEADQARLNRTRDFFERYGTGIGPKYIKKISALGIWELRAGKIRLFLCIRGDKAIGVHLIYKKSNKLLLKDIKLVERRSKQL